MVERKTEQGSRGRPRHVYQASVEANRQLGQNYADLAVVLWDEMMRTVEDRKLRRVLFGRITERLAELYRSQVSGRRMGRPAGPAWHVLHGRGIETEVTRGDGGLLPVSSSIPAPTTRSRRPIGRSARWNGRCSRRFSAAAYGSASAGSTATARATSRPSRI